MTKRYAGKLESHLETRFDLYGRMTVVGILSGVFFEFSDRDENLVDHIDRFEAGADFAVDGEMIYERWNKRGKIVATAIHFLDDNQELVTIKESR